MQPAMGQLIKGMAVPNQVMQRSLNIIVQRRIQGLVEGTDVIRDQCSELQSCRIEARQTYAANAEPT